MRECETQRDGGRMNVTHEMQAAFFIIGYILRLLCLRMNLEEEGGEEGLHGRSVSAVLGCSGWC